MVKGVLTQLAKKFTWYDWIHKVKKEAKTRLKISQLLALAPKNDPFYVGSKGDLTKAEWVAKVYELMKKPKECHIRAMHYWLVSRRDIKKPDGTHAVRKHGE
jgi:hypothetical protein